MVYKEIPPEVANRPIADPNPDSNSGLYSAMSPDVPEGAPLYPHGAGPTDWIKEYCWEKEETVEAEITDEDLLGNILASILTGGLLAPALNWKTTITKRKVKYCHFVIRDLNGNVLKEEDREVSSEKVKGKPIFGGNYLNPMSAAAKEAVDTSPMASAPGKETNSSKSEKSKSTHDKPNQIASSSDQKKPTITVYDVLLYAADVTPSDEIENYWLIPSTSVGNGYFTKIAYPVKPGQVLSGKEMKQFALQGNLGKEIKLDSYYQIMEIIPQGGRRRYLKDYKLGILDNTQVKVKVELKEDKLP